MTKYWYCLFDPDYRGNYNIRSTTSFKAACANLRKMLSDSAAETGCIFDSDPSKLPPRYEFEKISPTLVASMVEGISSTRKVSVMQFKQKFPAIEYILIKRKPRTAFRYWPEYIVHYDGSLTPRKK